MVAVTLIYVLLDVKTCQSVYHKFQQGAISCVLYTEVLLSRSH